MNRFCKKLSVTLHVFLVCVVVLAVPMKAVAVSALPTVKVKSTLTTRLAYRIVQKRLMRAVAYTDKPCAVLLKKDGTEVFVNVISRSHGKLVYRLCGETKKEVKRIPYDSISAVRFHDNILWRPYAPKELGRKGDQSNLGVISLVLSSVGLLTLVLYVGVFLCMAGFIVGIIGLGQHTRKRWAAVLGVILGAVPLIFILAAIISLAFWTY